jgi:hypothetical protein
MPKPGASFLLLLAFGLCSLQAQADVVDLGESARVSGRVTAIDAEGHVTIDSELADHPLRIRAEAVQGVRFDPSINDKLSVPDQEVQLSNGDAIPCRIESMDAKTIRVSTWYAGKLEIPREHVAALHFGISKPRPILVGSKAVQGWSKSDAWTIDTKNSSFKSTGNGHITRKLDSELPERYIIRFHYAWKNSPSLRFHFAANPFDEKSHNRYLLTINVAGFEVKRQSPVGRTYTSLSQSPMRSEIKKNDGMDIELRVDRGLKEPLFLLFINGTLIDRFTDPVKNAPSGPNLMLEITGGGKESNTITDFELLEWSGDSSERRKRVKSSPDSDTVYDRQGEHFSGKAMSIGKHDDRNVIVFQHPHTTEPLRIPLDQAATLWFHPASAAPENTTSPIVLGLVDNGLLHVESCTMDKHRAECIHPILGKLTIKRSAVSTINPGKNKKGS